MAVLEFEFKGIDQNFRSSASNVLNDIDKIKKAFSSIGVGIGVDLKTALDSQKVALNDTKIQTQELVKVGKELDNQNKQTRNSIAELTLEQKKLTAEQRATRANLQDSPYSRLSRELNEMRNEAKNLGAEMLKLSMRGDTTSKEYLKLEQAFNKVQSKITPLDSSLKKLDSSLGQNQRRVGAYGNALSGFESAQGSANGVALEFTRIIQDAPYGMMGIGNNIQQLTSNFGAYRDQLAQVATQQGKTLTSMQMFQGIATSFLSTGNLIALAVAGITSAWTYYTMQQQKANKATKEAKEATEDFRKSLDTLSRVQLEASTNANKDLTRLKMLSVVYKDNASSSKQRELALNGIVNLYKTYFPNLTLEQAKIEALSGKYAKLTEEILRTSRARGYEQILAEKQTDNINALAKQSSARNNINKAIDEYRREVEKGGKKLNKTNEELFSQFYDQLNTKGVKPLTEMPKNANSFIKASVGVYQAILKYNGLQRNSISTQQSYNEIFQQYLKDVKDGKISIEEFNTKLEEAKGSDSLGNSLKNISEKAKEAIDYLKELQSLSGVSEKDISLVGKVGLDFDVASIKYDYEERIKQIQTLQEQILADTTLTEAKRQELIEETNTYIAYLTGNVLANIKDLSNKATEYLDRMTVKAVKTYKDVEIAESPKQKQGRNREDDKDWKDYANILNQSVNSIFTNLKSNIDEFGLKARSVFYTLGESLGELIKQLANKNTAKFIKQLTDGAKDFKGIADNFSNMWKNNKGQVIGAGLGMAGSAVSSLGGGWDIVGSGLSGAASGLAAGAATGAAGGGPWGAAIGAVVGMTAGILKQAKNRRQEKILIKQMEEQKKANVLLERMSALSYASQIIGQKTEYGIVSGVRRNEFGQIVSVVQGQDIIMVADRANKQKGR